MTHIARATPDESLYDVLPVCGTAPKPDDSVVLPESAMDPVILEIDCPQCAAIVSKELRDN